MTELGCDSDTIKLMPCVHIEGEIVELILEHARLESPLECCGLLMGKGDRITHISKMRNVVQSPARYEMSPKELFKFFKDLQTLGLRHLGIYHSHPVSQSYPSPIDIAEAYYPDCTYFIVSLLILENPILRAFSIISGIVEEKRIERCSS